MCPQCHRRVVQIDVRLDDVTVTMHACSTCDTRWWDRDGRPVKLETILDLVSSGS